MQTGRPQYTSLVELFDEACETHAGQTAFRSFGASLSYRELEHKADAFASYLRSLETLERGDRVAVMLPNLLQYPVVLFGIFKAGMIVSNVNPLYGTHELKHQLCDSDAKAIVVIETAGALLADVIADTGVRHVIVTGVGDMLGAPKSLLINAMVRCCKTGFARRRLAGVKFNCALKRGRELQPARKDTADALKPHDAALLQYTGGTTGLAKGATLTHANLLANIEQMERVFPHLKTPQGGQQIVTMLPLYHIFSLTVNCLLFISLGGCNTLIADPRNSGRVIKTLKTIPFNIITGVNTLFRGLLDHPKFARLDFSTLHTTISGGMATQHYTATWWERVTGCVVLQGYGLTEASPVVSVNPPAVKEFDGSVGPPLPDTEISVRNEQGEELPRDEHGELYVRGAQVMSGYWQNPEETAAVLDRDGWLRTGDIAYIDARGFLCLVDRAKNMIVVSGFNVYPNEVEDVLCEHPNIAEAACIGVDNAHSGQSVKAFVVERRQGLLTEEAVIAHCHDQLAHYKAPQAVVFRRALPKSTVGKVLHRKLRDSP